MAVHSLNSGQEIALYEPNADVIQGLEYLLDMAKDGRLQSFIGTGFMSDGLNLISWLDYHDDIYQMLGALEWIKAQYIHTHIEE